MTIDRAARVFSCMDSLAAVGEPRRAAGISSAAFLVVLAACALSPLAHAGEPSESDVAAARAATKDLGETLKAQLVAAIQAGGPRSAVGVCRTVAPVIAKEASETHGLTVGRTALKVRNPANAPDAFERKTLDDFVQKIESGTDPATLERAEVIVENGETVFRYLKAIPTAAEPCLACHGTQIEPGLKAEIQRLYPEDQATGFRAGELRGAFTVTRKIR
ncbi:DUF3365 domain-containing protein [Hyphomicrobium sp.]|uniref:Tll0287-like domain-containing protein n=1 Tax=Hyphomicrobium sp. TaxID=82 RepID=UPI0025C06FF5|nr:DUF3365 domain-containing protein [Hyphomicrobium sp.]MCC7254253.1 DUF3365 domain-containing protein [Hyphomicrobium sp.]